MEGCTLGRAAHLQKVFGELTHVSARPAVNEIEGERPPPESNKPDIDYPPYHPHSVPPDDSVHPARSPVQLRTR